MFTESHNINVGTARMIITGMGYYSGTKTVYFTINAFDVSKGSLRLDSDRLVYTGKAQQLRHGCPVQWKNAEIRMCVI